MEDPLLSRRSLDPQSDVPHWKDLVREPPRGSHILQIYENRELEIEAAVLFAAEGLQGGERVCCTGSSRDLLYIRKGLEAGGLDVDSTVRDGTLVLVSRIDLNGGGRNGNGNDGPSLDRFVDEMFAGVPERYPGVRWWSNGVARSFEAGQFAECIAFERSCHERRETLPWSLLCAYNARRLTPDRHAAAFWDVLRNHSHLIPAGELGVALKLFPNGVDP
jgi:hypothetical protein